MDVENELIRRFKRIKDWAIGREHQAADWYALLDAAELAQQVEPERLIGAIQRYMGPDPSLEAEAQVCLLLRMMFDATNAPGPPVPYDPAKWGPTEFAKDLPTSTYEWPLSWAKGVPLLACSYFFARHYRYDVVGEYRFFAQHGTARDLAEVRRKMDAFYGER